MTIQNNYANTRIIDNDVYAVKDGDTYWGGVTNHNFEILAELNKRPKLTITYGDVEENSMPVKQWQYSVVGNDVLIQLPRQSIPQVDHFNLIIKQDGVEVGRYNDTQDKVINLVSPEYAKIVFEKNGQVLQTYEPTGNDVTITIPDVQIDNKTLTIKQGDTVLGEFDNSENKTITIPTSSISNGTLTLKLGDTVLGSFTSDTDATIVIPEQTNSQTVEVNYGTLTLTQGNTSLGSFTANSDVTIDIPKEEQHKINFLYNNNSIGEFDNTEDVDISIPSYSHYKINFTQNNTSLGEFDNTEDVTIDIPLSSFNGVNINIKKSEDYEDLNGDTVFTTAQTFNTATSSDINSYNLTLNVNGQDTVYNPFVESKSITIDTSTGGSAILDDISESISFEVPYSSSPVLPTDPPASVRTETYYIKDVNGTPKSISKTIKLPVNYVDIHDGDPSDPTTCIGHWHLYNSCELQLNLSAYAKKTDLVTYTNVSELANDVGYIAEADADLKYILRSERNVANGVAALNAEGHLVLPSGIEIW